MKILKESILNEEDFEDVQADEFEDQQPENVDEPSDGGEESSADNVEEPVEDTAGEDTTGEDAPENTEPVTDTTVWKVKFKLGDNENWSRFAAETKEEAEGRVASYVTRKWPDREFEILETEKYIEEELAEQLNESTITDAQPIEDAAAVGMATVISDLIKDEYESIDNYNSAIATAEAEGFTDMVRVLSEIQAEENLHVGQLQAIMNTLDPNAHLVDDGQQEGIEQLSGDLSMDDTITEDLEDMSLQDQRMFIRCVNEIWNMSVMEWTQKYYDGLLEVTTVDTYDDIPDTSNLIEISSSDMSQGTGNVIIYTYMDAGDGSLYRYADF